MNNFTCYICREEKTIEEDLPEVGEGEALLCGECAEFVNIQNQMTGVVDNEY